MTKSVQKDISINTVPPLRKHSKTHSGKAQGKNHLVGNNIIANQHLYTHCLGKKEIYLLEKASLIKASVTPWAKEMYWLGPSTWWEAVRYLGGRLQRWNSIYHTCREGMYLRTTEKKKKRICRNMKNACYSRLIMHKSLMIYGGKVLLQNKVFFLLPQLLIQWVVFF